MGDRGNAGIRFEDGTVLYLYTHWQGSDVMSMLARGLERVRDAGRLSDSYYGARLIFQEWTRDHEDDDVGFGMGPDYAEDCEHPIPIFDFATKNVTYDPEKNAPGDVVTLSVVSFINTFLKSEA